ncbi:MAG: hypothetical protein JOZ73_13710 [Solirubrobacterales bacterium]|nr:hypothetical protein [Solirubrobacterales bacterium]
MSGDERRTPASADQRGGGASDDPQSVFASGTSGEVSGIRRTASAVCADALADLWAVMRLRQVRLARAARRWPKRRVLALAVERENSPTLIAAARAELLRTKHDVRFASIAAGSAGKFENINRLLGEHPVGASDWLLIVDDDVGLPSRFVDSFVFLAERFELQLAQPAHRRRSHAAWEVTRRRTSSVVRETAFVEIGPVTAFHSTTFDALLPFPNAGLGWGLDAYWSGLGRELGWRLGVIDATPIAHGVRRIASSYDRAAATRAAAEFLVARPRISAAEASRTLVTHRSWR